MAYMLTESIANTVILYIIIKKLSTPFKEWDAYKYGVIDDKGKLIRKPETSKERESWSMFDRFIANLKKILAKFVGPSRMAAILTATVLLKDSQVGLLKHDMLTESGLDEGLTAARQLEIKRFIDALRLPKMTLKEGDFDSQQQFEFAVMKYTPIVMAMIEDRDLSEMFDIGEDL